MSRSVGWHAPSCRRACCRPNTCAGARAEAVLRSYTVHRGSCRDCGWRGVLTNNGTPRLHDAERFPETDPRYALACWYCRRQRPDTDDHVVPRTRRREATRAARVVGREIPPELFEVVPACHECNQRKGTRLLAPECWAHLIPALNALGIGTFRTWDGEALPEIS